MEFISLLKFSIAFECNRKIRDLIKIFIYLLYNISKRALQKRIIIFFINTFVFNFNLSATIVNFDINGTTNRKNCKQF